LGIPPRVEVTVNLTISLLRARRERPRSRSAAKLRDERTAVHSITSSWSVFETINSLKIP
jgi:hypothetical protein